MTARQLLTFRLDLDFRQRLRTRLAGEGRSLSEVVVHGLQLYLQQGSPAPAAAPAPAPAAPPVAVEETAAGQENPGETSAVPVRHASAGPPGPSGTAVASVADLSLPPEVEVYLRDLRSSGQSELLSAALAALYGAGWPLRPLAAALGISRQAVLARVRQQVPAVVRALVPAVPPPAPFPRRRSTRPDGRRPHLTVKIDQTLRAAAHRRAQREGNSLSQVIERILEHYLRHGLPAGETRPETPAKGRPAARRRRKSSAPAGGGS